MLLIYGVTGYTGKLIVRTAVQQGIKPILGGRTEAKLKPVADELGLSYRVFSLGNQQTIDALQDIDVVLNAAGPFSITLQPFIDACLLTGSHYLDIMGEVDEFAAAYKRDRDAQRADIMLMPGVGFGVVPTDSIAHHLKHNLPTATHLMIAFQTIGGASQGTMRTLLKNLHQSGYVRENGVLVTASPAQFRRKIDFGDGEMIAVLNPWRGDILTAYHTTGIPNIEAYSAFPLPVPQLMMAPISGMWNSTGFQQFLDWVIDKLPSGPNEQSLATGKTIVWGEVHDAQGTVVRSRLFGPEAYEFTAKTAIAIAQQALSGKIKVGFQTPAAVYGSEFVLSIDGVSNAYETER